MSGKIKQEIITAKGKKITIEVEEDGSVYIEGAQGLSGSFHFTDDFVGVENEEIYVIIQRETGALPGLTISTNRPYSFSPGFPPRMKARFRRVLTFGEKNMFVVQAFKGDDIKEESIELGKLPIVKKDAG